jgi:hypothetical protein
LPSQPIKSFAKQNHNSNDRDRLPSSRSGGNDGGSTVLPRSINGFGTEFLAEVERTIAAIVSHPKAAPKVKPDIRRRLLKRFPFGILYATTVDEIVVLAVMHLRRRPGYWQDRLGSSKQSQ